MSRSGVPSVPGPRLSQDHAERSSAPRHERDVDWGSQDPPEGGKTGIVQTSTDGTAIGWVMATIVLLAMLYFFLR